jgi:Winged helix DNA-binding domain
MIHLLPEEFEAYRDKTWRRLPERRVEDAAHAERLVEDLGFCATLTDARRPGPSLYIAVCGRRDAYMPRNVQKDPESSLAWVIKDELLRRGRVYYAKLVKGKSTFIAPRLIPHFNALWGVPRKKESEMLSPNARAILKVLRREWEMGTRDLRVESGVTDRPRFTRAIDELQRAMKVIAGEVLYEPTFTYIWTLAEARFPKEISTKVTRREALREVARAFLQSAGLTVPGELARVTGLSRRDAGLGNHSLVDEGYAARIGVGVYRLAGLEDDIGEFDSGDSGAQQGP